MVEVKDDYSEGCDWTTEQAKTTHHRNSGGSGKRENTLKQGKEGCENKIYLFR